MIDVAKLKEAIDQVVAGEIRSALKPHEIEIVSTLLEAARLVLAAQAAPGAFVAARRAYSEHAGTSCHPEAMADALIAACLKSAIEAVAASLHRPVEARVTEERRFRHKKRGSTYKLIGWAEAHSREPLTDAEVVAVYRCEQDGNIWVRRKSEFEDGRFEELPAAFLPSPQVTREQIIDAISADVSDFHVTAGQIADRILSLFDGRAKP